MYNLSMGRGPEGIGVHVRSRDGALTDVLDKQGRVVAISMYGPLNSGTVDSRYC